MFVKIICVLLCYFDIMVFEFNEVMSYFDQFIIFGYEVIGQVVEFGVNVKGFNVGDKVGFLLVMNVCFECMLCKNV